MVPSTSHFVPIGKICTFALGGEGLRFITKIIKTMAKGNFLTNTVRGKLGEMVGYKNTNSNDKVKQGWRAYVPHISNPKTAGQAAQRMIVSNLTQNYSALKEIISRGFEGFKYGGKSYQRFLSLNMKNSGQGPFIPKGTRSTPLPIPGMVLSQGSLISIAVTGMNTFNNVIEGHKGYYFISDLDASAGAASMSDPALTWGQFSQKVIDSNTDVKDGDQLTFITVTATENLEYVYRFKSVVIDINSDETLGVPYAGSAILREYHGVQLTLLASGDNRLVLFNNVTALYDEVPVAAAVIQSRQGSNGEWLRSSSSLWVDTQNEEITQYFTDEMYQVAMESYMGTGHSITSDWPTDPDTSLNAAWGKALTRAYFTIDETSHSAAVASLVSSDFSTIKYIVKTENGVQFLTNSDGSVFSYNDTPVAASMLIGTSATRELVDITGLAEYNISNLRSAAPVTPAVESDTKTTKKTAKKE